MTTLEEYLAHDYRSDSQEVESLNRFLKQAASTFDVTFSDDHWPYKYSVRNQVKSGKKSQGTLAMVLCATGKLLGTCEMHSRNSPIEDGGLLEKWNTALETLIEQIDPQPAVGLLKEYGHFQSSTFGDDNAMTLSHVAELHAALLNESAFEARVAPKLRTAILNLASGLEKSVETPLLFPKENGEYRPGAFVLLRLLRACRDVGEQQALPTLRQFFESGLHDQLSFSTIPDSRFDAAELLFSLEGLLLCAPEAVDAPSFERVLEVLAEKQNTSAHWRPNRPFMSSDTGAIMLPLSIECANSFMRSVAIMDQGRTFDLFAAKSLPLLHRFWNWLQARSVRFSHDSQDCVGWHSEHVNETDLIHIWDTSQIVEFMIAYRNCLHTHIAHRTLELSGVKVRRPKPLGRALPKKSVGDHDWEDVKADREPLSGRPSDEQIYTQIGEHFIAPRAKDGKGTPSYSMLLYGPPGTGKSMLAQLMADALAWPMLTVTVSDFLGSGGAMVEARAKAIFQMLEAQSEVVILFDEIDAFLLDRDSSFYRDQETLFQFLTPGMLTKINDLRQEERSIFIVATNYANRIDPAIKRIGRIDHKLLLLPPNLQRRTAMIEKAWPEGVSGRKIEEKISDDMKAMAKASCYLGWNDIKGALKHHTKGGLANTIKRLEEADRSTGPSFYGRRFPAEGSFDDEILKEIEGLYQLANEAERADFIGEFKTAAAEAVTGNQDRQETIKKVTSFTDDLVAKPQSISE